MSSQIPTLSIAFDPSSSCPTCVNKRLNKLGWIHSCSLGGGSIRDGQMKAITISLNAFKKLLDNKQTIQLLSVLLQVQNLSGGELQRTALALCLGKPADVYLIDEPSAYLDSEQRLHAAKVIKRYNIFTTCDVVTGVTVLRP